MQYFIRGLSFFLTAIVINGLLNYWRHPKNVEEGNVCLPRSFAVLGAVASAVFLIPAFITAFSDQADLWVPILFLLLASLGAVAVIAFVNCRISYDEDGFVSRNFFGIKRTVTYEQVTAIRENKNETFLYIGKRRILVDRIAVGGYEFIKLVKKKYRTLHGGQYLPRVTKVKGDIFKGNIHDPGSFLFVYILVAVVMIGVLIFTVCHTYFSPSTANNTEEHGVSFVSCESGDGELILTPAKGRLYKIRFIEEPFDAEKIRALCDGEQTVTVYCEEITPDDEEAYYSVKAILQDGVYLLTFEQTNQWHRDEYGLLVVFAAGLCLLWGLFVAASIVVGRNPKKFSKRVIRAFFKNEYVRD